MIKVMRELNKENLINALYSYERKKSLGLDKTIMATENVIEKWRERLMMKSDSLFQTKLELSGLTEEEFAQSITKIEDLSLNEDELEELVSSIKSSMNFDLFSEGLSISEEKKYASEQLDLSLFIRPFLSIIADRLDKMLKEYLVNHYSNLVQIKERFLLSIGTQLLTQASRSIILEMHVSKISEELYGNTSEEKFQSFIKERAINTERLMQFYEEYATLTRILLLRSEFFLTNVETTLKNYNQDYTKLNGAFGLAGEELISIDFGLGDTHQKGKTVGKFVYKSGKTIIYKPKGLSISLKYNQLLEWIAERADFATLSPYQILDFGTHGWEEMVEYRPCKTENEVKDYFRRFGVMVGLMHSLKGADFHLENIIASGDTPYIIDHETLFHQSPRLDFPDSVEVKLKYEQADSVIGTGLLPIAMFKNAEGKGIDLSALNGREQELPFKVLKIENSMTDDMKFTMQPEVFRGANNLPKLNGKELNAEDFLEDILIGFKNIFTFFIENKELLLDEEGPIGAFKHEKIRIVARATQQYFNFLNESSHPDYMRDALYLENLYDRLWFYPFEDKRIIPHEIMDLLEGDIPFFTTTVDSTDLYTSRGIVIDNIFKESGYQLVQSRIQRYDENEMNTQLGWIKTAIIGTKADNNKVKIAPEKWTKPEVPDNISQRFIDEARLIANQILSKLVFSETKDKASLLSLNPNGDNRWSVSPAFQGLYDGLGGISLFMLYMWKETKEEKYKVAAEATLRSAIQPMVESKGLISAFTGPFSLLYPLQHFQKYFYKQEFCDEINALKERINVSVEKDEVFDFLSGAAGISYSLMNGYEVKKDQEFLDIAKLYGDYLVQQVHILNDSQMAWKNPATNTYLGGLAHGTSGFALSLLRLAHLTGEENYREVAIKALNYDRSLFNPELSVWKDNRFDGKNYLHQWCHGSTGIGLSRIVMSKFSNSGEYDQEILQAVQNLQIQGYKNSDNLCHGNFGDVELFLQAGAHFDDEDLIKEAQERSYNIILQKEKRGYYQIDGPNGFIQPSLFTGLAGIGYQLLRVYNPENVPAVMMLEK